MDLGGLFANAGCTGFVHAVTVDGAAQVDHDADEPVVPASVIKVLVAVEAETRFASGELDPTERVRLGAAERTAGPVGMSLFSDEAEISMRDLVVLMLTISDNVATDALLGRIGLSSVNAAAERLGLTATRVTSSLHDLLDSVARDAGSADWSSLRPLLEVDPAAWRRLRAARSLQPHAPTRTTARNMTRLLRLIWTDQAGPPQACRRVRDTMADQLTKHRLAAGFGPGVTVAAKSGGLFGVVRNEIGVVTLPGRTPVAVAAFTRCEDGDADERLVDAAIASAAAEVVERLSGPA